MTNSRPQPRPYLTPEIELLGSIAERTAGPDGGEIDQLVGGSGGFRSVQDPS